MMAVTLLTPETRRRLSETDQKWQLKLALRTFAALLALIGMAAMAAAVPPWNAHFFHSEGATQGDWQDGLVIAPFVIALLYYFGTTTYMFRATSPVHPAITIGVDFIIWALLIPAITFAAWGGLFNVWRPAVKTDGKVECDIFNILARECSPILYSVGGLELGAVVLGCIVWFFHFAFFVWAIRELVIRRKIAKNARYQNFNFELESQVPVQPSLQIPDFLAKELELNKPAPTVVKVDRETH